jgi:hypothetical protein
MIQRHAFRDPMKQRRFAGPRRCDDQRPLTIADWRNEVDRAANELIAAACRAASLEGELSLRI